MPYIKQERREVLEPALAGVEPKDQGELNYAITVICQTYLKQQGLRYRSLNDVIGALECAKLEMYRRVAVPYENSKILENGDVMALDSYHLAPGYTPG